MSLSLNETHKLVKDAGRGSGLPWGEADELARAAVWLEIAGCPGLMNACRKIDEQLNTLAAAPELVQQDGEWRFTPKYASGDGRIDILRSAVCARDLLTELSHETRSTKQIIIASVFLPILAIGVLAPAGRSIDGGLSIEIMGDNGAVSAAFHVTGNNIHIHEYTLVTRPTHPLVDISIVAGTTPSISKAAATRCIWSPAIHRHALETGLSPDRQALETLRNLAHNCLVPATEESRLKGAGAGTVDRD